MMHQMILAAVVAGIVVGPASAWPISPLDDYRVDSVVTLHCNDVTTFRVVDRPVTFNFHDSYDGKLPEGCFIHIRIEEQDQDVEQVGLHVAGTMDLHDDANIDSGINKCQSSYLSIADEDGTDDEMGHLDLYCSNNTFSFKTTEDIINLELKVGENGANGTGFSITVSPHSLCGGRVDSTQEISTPDFPEYYPPNMACYWYIKGEKISINFLEMDLKPRRGRKCKDQVKIHGYGRKPEIYCEDELQYVTLSYDNHAILEFKSGPTQDYYKGFKTKVTIKNSGKRKSDLLSKFYKKEE